MGALFALVWSGGSAIRFFNQFLKYPLEKGQPGKKKKEESEEKEKKKEKEEEKEKEKEEEWILV